MPRRRGYKRAQHDSSPCTWAVGFGKGRWQHLREGAAAAGPAQLEGFPVIQERMHPSPWMHPSSCPLLSTGAAAPSSQVQELREGQQGTAIPQPGTWPHFPWGFHCSQLDVFHGKGSWRKGLCHPAGMPGGMPGPAGSVGPGSAGMGSGSPWHPQLTDHKPLT